jgi:uncharacterized protein YqeY
LILQIDKQLDKEEHLKMLEDEMADLREQLSYHREDGREDLALDVEKHLSELQEQLDTGNY